MSLPGTEAIFPALERLYATAHDRLKLRVSEGGKIAAAKLDREQLAAHALAYLMTEYQAALQLQAWAQAVTHSGEGGAYEQLIAQTYVAELVRSLRGGIDLGQTELIPLSELGIGPDVVADTIGQPDIVKWADAHTSAERYLELAAFAREKGGGALGLADDTLVASQREFRKFVDREVKPVAQEIHRKDILIPLEIVQKLSALGVFGLTIPEEFGGLGLGKIAMCVVTEELSRGYIGVGSLGTRAEIAAELILGGGTDAQKAEWLPKIAAGEVLPTAVFTEPNNGSDLAHIQTRAAKEGGSWKVRGQKTWITHACRADLMTLLARTKPGDPGYGGLSMFLAPKTRTGEPGKPEFVDHGLTGTEIKVLGYRGMKEYELSFDGFDVPEGALLGGVEGQGFKQLMATFESARIQTAARGVGVAQAALEEAMGYAQQRIQFGKPIFEFPRVARKIARMVCRTQAARQLTYYAAKMKDGGKRCDLEAGMAKLLATRAAWEAADACVQIHGGNGFAEEYTASRLLVDARVLSIFEGANEIQAHVIARRLLEQ
ncbi:MAG TPA: acyl-CoA dehydrogenase family protein [Polyangiaceae bacterium]|jgi:(2S)-methylsuccinyl-CoA dehydrogenase